MVEFELTEICMSLTEPFSALAQWAATRRPQIETARNQDARNGSKPAPVKLRTRPGRRSEGHLICALQFKDLSRLVGRGDRATQAFDQLNRQLDLFGI